MFPAGQKDLDLLRWQIATTVLEASEDLTDMCCVCSAENLDNPEQDENTTWIACDVCGSWFHHVFVAFPNTAETFVRMAC
ncbi:hypothetical protein ATANTOWER_023789 [Ataeniobius toweri]|uniref:Uncharacterized protein n=1 Tax=Ataeniobius toweri TaxID=208326 RepID=A0ABU7C1W5_9TELE|nr:hypothetical protein [Ataeniobius toweri]